MILPFYNPTDKITYWTHSSFLDDDKFLLIEEQMNSLKWYRRNIAILGGLIGYKLTQIPAIVKLLPSKVHLGIIPIASIIFSYTAAHIALVTGAKQKKIQTQLEKATIPLWKSKLQVVNLARVYFHLDDFKNNQIDVLHHGLTAENAYKLFPDLVKGPLPKPPKKHDPHDNQHDSHGGKH